MRRIINGVESIILEEDGYGGFVSIEVEKLTMKMEELFSEEALLEAEPNMPPGFREMPFIAVIKSNVAGNNSMGWKKYQQVLNDEGFEKPHQPKEE